MRALLLLSGKKLAAAVESWREINDSFLKEQGMLRNLFNKINYLIDLKKFIPL